MTLIGPGRLRPVEMYRAAKETASNMLVKARVFHAVMKVTYYLPELQRCVGSLLNCSSAGLVLDHYDFRATSTAAFMAARKGLEQAGYKLLHEREHEGANQAAYTRPASNCPVVITGPAPAVNYAGKPDIFLDHIGFILPGEGFARAFQGKDVRTLMASGDLALKARMLSREEMSGRQAELAQSPAGRMILSFSRVEVFDQSPGEFMLKVKAMLSLHKPRIG